MVKGIGKLLLLVAVFVCGMVYGSRSFDGHKDLQQTPNVIDRSEEPQENLPDGNSIRNEAKDSRPTSNHFSQLGDAMAKAITGLFRGAVTMVSAILQHLLADSYALSRN